MARWPVLLAALLWVLAAVGGVLHLVLRRGAEPWVLVDEFDPNCNSGLSALASGVMRSVRVMPPPSDGEADVKILCVVNTHAGHTKRQAAVKASWVTRCDEYVFASNETDAALPAIRIEHGDEAEDNLWSKTRALGLVLDQWPTLDQYDWVFRADDDTFVIVENLRHFLRSPEVTRFQPRRHRLLLGHILEPDADSPHIAGSSMVMSHAFIKAFADVVRAGHCNPLTRTHADDTMLSDCFLQLYGDRLVDTRDELRRARFHCLNAEGVAVAHAYNNSQWYTQMHGRFLKSGLDCCSDRSISFHYADRPGNLMVSYAREVYGCRKSWTDDKT